jgi:hypothetical protein
MKTSRKAAKSPSIDIRLGDFAVSYEQSPILRLAPPPKGCIIILEERMERAILQAHTSVNITTQQARQWFLSLKTHPERYQFDTHAGFAFTEGDFGEVGARFQTWEQFHGIEINLYFELTETGESHFRFRLLRPPLPIWCTFRLIEKTDDVTGLHLEVGATNSLGLWFLRFPLIKPVIQEQIQGEVDHIKASMEAICGPA